MNTSSCSCGGPHTPLLHDLWLLVLSSSRSSCCSESDMLREYVTRQVNVALWFSLIALTALLLRRLFRILRFWAKARLIPGPPCPSFFFPHYHLIASSSNFTDLLSKLHEEYGPLVKLWLGPTQLLVSIKNPELVQEMLIKAKDKSPLTGRAFHLSFGRSSFFVSSSNAVQKGRDLLATELNSKCASVVTPRAKKYVIESIQNAIACGGAESKRVSQHLAFSFLGAMLFGDSFLFWYKATVYEELLMMIARDAYFWASNRVTPFWRKGFWRYRYLCTKLKFLTRELIQQRRENYELSSLSDIIDVKGSNGLGVASATLHLPDVIVPPNLLLQGLDDAREDSSGVIASVMFHGSLTMSVLIGSILTRLATSPDLQDEILSEIVMTQNYSRGHDKQEVNKMPLLLATVYESARLLPGGLLLQRYSSEHDIKLKTGAKIPAGAILGVPLHLLHVDNSNWGSDACRFNPYRFMSKTEENCDPVQIIAHAGKHKDIQQASYVINDPNKNAAFLPFGSGTRACPGQKFAILGVASLFATLLECYEIRLEPGFCNDSKQIFDNRAEAKIAFVKREKA